MRGKRRASRLRIVRLQAVHMSREAQSEKPAALSLSRPVPMHLVEAPGHSFTALLNRSALGRCFPPLR